MHATFLHYFFFVRLHTTETRTHANKRGSSSFTVNQQNLLNLRDKAIPNTYSVCTKTLFVMKTVKTGYILCFSAVFTLSLPVFKAQL